MLQFVSLMLSVASDARTEWVAIRGEFPGYRDESKRTGGLESVWFVLSRAELADASRGRLASARDGVHTLAVSGDRWTFYDMDGFPRDSRGVMEVRYAHVNMPREVVRLLYRWALQVWAKQAAMRAWAEANPRGDYEARHACDERAALDLMPYVARWTRVYGQGKGRARLDMDDRTRPMFERAMAMGGNFAAKVDQILTIARNETDAADQTVDVPIYRDAYRDDNPCFTWRSGGLFGGLVNHGKDGAAPDWSLHT